MDFRYLPATKEDKDEMLQKIGASNMEELFEDIPESIRFQKELNLPEPASERKLINELYKQSDRNSNTNQYTSFLGAGVYDHYIPSVVDHVIRRSEFYTAYTPYQPEISQGELQAIFEFQTMICELTAMPVANSSMYDGHTALFEAALMAVRQSKMKKTKIVVSEGVHPESVSVLDTYARGADLTVVQVPLLNGQTDIQALADEMDEKTAAVIVQYPTFYGSIENLKDVEPIIHKQDALFIVSSNPLSLGVLTPPGEYGADVVVGDVQPLGIPMQMGGPHCGYFATTNQLMRKVPGRLVGQTLDENQRRGFVLTLQTREQHIRRSKATSNICSNQALNALAASVAMSALGKRGIREMAVQNVKKANYLRNQLKSVGGITVYENPIFNEFVIKTNQAVASINHRLYEKGIIGGFDLANIDDRFYGQMLVCVTELRTRAEMDGFVKEMEGLV
ncbi:aminomethyl-transferring glycine dehydrogenase subunit GcvPA [Salibacterium salarium]|uniref:Probable glycine dehydrogenase (decarboxylating) subunit 1 n=1 Tax=Salibacterium salarium TaxID=284579 RepID=A0A428MXR8_9BACI|nr:aminomethyl-transferring glycine dehydrogenase subunit GcvPA [Salibacterium salarium]RSL30953.1 aminomethyl-transferring glycine dehydrogenase subunit GcvPA [Salibacterium salarium]